MLYSNGNITWPIMKESRIMKSFHIVFCALLCNMRFRNVKTINAFLIIPDVPKWNLILWWQVSYIHEIITQTKISVTKMIAKCVTIIDKYIVMKFKKIEYKYLQTCLDIDSISHWKFLMQVYCTAYCVSMNVNDFFLNWITICGLVTNINIVVIHRQKTLVVAVQNWHLTKSP